jgi:hypothetical protein
LEKLKSVKEVLSWLDREGIALPPLAFIPAGRSPSPTWGDIAYDVKWKGKRTFRFIADVKSRVTSQALAAAAHRAKALAFDAPGSVLLLVVPYLSRSSINEAEKLGISAVDLCGNGVVQVPPQWIVVRSGRPNRFGGAEPLRGAYSGVASLVARSLALQPAFARVSDVRSFIEARGGRITLGTVSKALARLQEDLVVAREARSVRLLQPEKLLSKLRGGYRPPAIRARLAMRARLPEPELHRRLRDAAAALGGRLAPTGLASAHRHAVLAAEPVASFYCSAPPDALARAASLDPAPERHFADLELQQTDDVRVYFDAREEDGRLCASPIQAWLELGAGDKRTQEIADELEARLLRDLGGRPAGHRTGRP